MPPNESKLEALVNAYNPERDRDTASEDQMMGLLLDHLVRLATLHGTFLGLSKDEIVEAASEARTTWYQEIATWHNRMAILPRLAEMACNEYKRHMHKDDRGKGVTITSRFYGSRFGHSPGTAIDRANLEEELGARHGTILGDMWTRYRESVEFADEWRSLAIFECRMHGAKSYSILPAYGFEEVRTAAKARDYCRVVIRRLRTIYEAVSETAPSTLHFRGGHSVSDTFRASWFSAKPACLPANRIPKSTEEKQQLKLHKELHGCEACDWDT